MFVCVGGTATCSGTDLQFFFTPRTCVQSERRFLEVCSREALLYSNSPEALSPPACLLSSHVQPGSLIRQNRCQQTCPLSFLCSNWQCCPASFSRSFFSLLLIHRLIDHIYGKSFCFDVARARWLFNLMLNVLRSFKKTSKPATRSSSVRDGQIAWHLAAVAVSSPCVCLWELSALGGSAPLLVHSQDHP